MTEEQFEALSLWIDVAVRLACETSGVVITGHPPKLSLNEARQRAREAFLGKTYPAVPE